MENNNQLSLQVSKGDVFWGYLAQFFSIATGLILLPLILRLLDTNEIGMNYIMISVGALVSLVDFGFSPQFGRNITYIFSGANTLLKSGVVDNDNSSQSIINFKLLRTTIDTAKWLYLILAVSVFVILITIGTAYIYYVTNGFTNTQNSLLAWLIYSVFIAIQIYFSYYNAFLTGAGKVKESRKTIVFSNLVKILVSVILLYLNIGLLAIVLGSLVQPVVTRIMAHKYFFTHELKNKLNDFTTNRAEISELFKILWVSSSKLGICSVSGYLTYGATTLLIGAFLTLKDVASFGLMTQLISLIAGIAGILFSVYQPRLISLRINKQYLNFISESSFTTIIYFITFIIGVVFLLFVVPHAIFYIGSSTTLPPLLLVFVASIIRFSDGNYWNFCQLILVENEFPFLRSALITAALIITSSTFTLYIGWGLWGIVIATGISQMAYNNWFWPMYFIKKYDLNFIQFMSRGVDFALLKYKFKH